MPIGLIVHGGAGMLHTDDHAGVLTVCRAAVAAGATLLRSGGSALDAVEAAVCVLEDDEHFNAGFGSVLNRDGYVEMDALVMDGQTFKIGAVAAVSRLKNPIKAARRVMDATPHHLLAGPGAEAFAQAQGLDVVSPDAMIAPRRLKDYQDRTGQPASDTVGAVALDLSGNAAVAVSTGGIRGKMPGRVGDSPIPGAGGYADNMLGAACATGVGEGIMRSLLTFRVVEAMAHHTAQEASDVTIALFEQKFGGDGGVIAIDRYGHYGIAHNSPFMPVAWLVMHGDEMIIQAQAQHEG
ncbi:MAG: isoaspartyl peptidase/L-asparaginase family protein [Anaerolineae bacterium]